MFLHFSKRGIYFLEEKIREEFFITREERRNDYTRNLEKLVTKRNGIYLLYRVLEYEVIWMNIFF